MILSKRKVKSVYTKVKKLFKILAVIVAVLAISAFGVLYYIDSKIYVPTKGGSKNRISNSVSALQSIINSLSNQKGIDSIVLAGTDGRSKETASRTDSIMMATIDRSNKAVKLTSFMRDMFVPIPGYNKNFKINTAYFLGGPELLIETLNQNFNTKAEFYVTIDFSAFQTLVNKFNGIDVNVKSYEIKEMNKYIKEENWGNPEFVTTSGLQHLSGQQVLSYCRIRKVGNNDYERTERQRRVLTLLIQKARKQNIFSLPGLMNSILPYIKTNIPSSKLLAFGISAYKFSKTPVSTIRIPAEGMYSNKVINGQDALIPDFLKNTELLNQFITSKDMSANKAATNTAQISSNNKSIAASRGNIDVVILNSTGKSGLADEYKTKLQALGYRITKTDNYIYKKYETTIINDYSKKGYGEILSKDLNFGNILIKEKAKPLASVVVILGTDSLK